MQSPVYAWNSSTKSVFDCVANEMQRITDVKKTMANKDLTSLNVSGTSCNLEAFGTKSVLGDKTCDKTRHDKAK